jgi:hypothetical protein
MTGWRWGVVLLAGGLCLGGLGCQDPHRPVPVGGVVTLDGVPVAGAMVSFIREGGDGKEGRMAYGNTDANGRFRLTTLQPDDGALPGTYRVIVTKSEPLPPPVPMPDFPNTPEGRARRENFLDRAFGNRPRTRNLLPERYGRVETTPFQVTVPTRDKVSLELSGSAPNPEKK